MSGFRRITEWSYSLRPADLLAELVIVAVRLLDNSVDNLIGAAANFCEYKDFDAFLLLLGISFYSN